MRDKHWALLVMVAVLGFLVGDRLAWSDRARIREQSPWKGADPSAPPVRQSSLPAAERSKSDATRPHETPRVAALTSDVVPLPAVAIPTRSEVARYVRYYSAGSGRASVSIWLRRAGPYVRMIRRTLQEYGVPTELLAVAIIESGMQPDAVSPAGATGMWQFMSETARSYQLQVDEGVDERRDPELATDAAARHLRDLYLELRDWSLALAAYNAGLTRVREELNTTASDDFWALTQRSQVLTRETVDYVPKVLAMMSILSHLSSHGFAPMTGDELGDGYVRVTLGAGLELSRVARGLGMSSRALGQINPAIVGGRTPRSDPGATLTIPSDRLRLAQLLVVPLARGLDDRRLVRRAEQLQRGAVVPSLPRACVMEPCAPAGDSDGWERLIEAIGGAAVQTYQVQRGDTPQKLADRFGIDAASLMEHNGVSDPRRIQVGQLLRLPELDRKAL